MGEEQHANDAPPLEQLRVFHQMMRQLHTSDKKTTNLLPATAAHHDDDSATSCSIQEVTNSPTFQLSFEKGNLVAEQRHQPSGHMEQLVEHKVVAPTIDTKCTDINNQEQRTVECHHDTTPMIHDESPRCCAHSEEEEGVTETTSSFLISSWAMLAWKRRTTQSRVLIATAGLLVAGVSLGYLLSGPPPGRRRRR